MANLDPATIEYKDLGLLDRDTLEALCRVTIRDYRINLRENARLTTMLVSHAKIKKRRSLISRKDTVRELHTFTMEKQSGGKKLSKHWDTRHFKLYTSGILEYYKKVADKKPCGQLDLSLCTKFENDDNDKLLTKITDPASARIWTLRSNNASDANKFRNCCRDLIGSALEKDICDLSG